MQGGFFSDRLGGDVALPGTGLLKLMRIGWLAIRAIIDTGAFIAGLARGSGHSVIVIVPGDGIMPLQVGGMLKEQSRPYSGFFDSDWFTGSGGSCWW